MLARLVLLVFEAFYFALNGVVGKSTSQYFVKLRFGSVTYFYVRSRRQILAFLVLLAFEAFYFALNGVVGKSTSQYFVKLRFGSVTYFYVRSRRQILAFLVLLAFEAFYFASNKLWKKVQEIISCWVWATPTK